MVYHFNRPPVGGQKVRCNALCPGGVDTGLPKGICWKIVEYIPMKYMVLPNEYQDALIFLLSAASSYMNGVIVNVEGGRTAWWFRWIINLLEFS